MSIMGFKAEDCEFRGGNGAGKIPFAILAILIILLSIVLFLIAKVFDVFYRLFINASWELMHLCEPLLFVKRRSKQNE